MAGRITLRMLARGKQDFALGECLCAAFMWVREWGAGVVRQSEWWVNGDSCVIGVMVDGNVWVQCMMGNVVHGWCAVWVSGNQIHNSSLGGTTLTCVTSAPQAMPLWSTLSQCFVFFLLSVLEKCKANLKTNMKMSMHLTILYKVNI